MRKLSILLFVFILYGAVGRGSPSAVGMLSVVVRSGDTVKLAWEDPNPISAGVKKYIIYSLKSPGSWQKQQDTVSTTATVSGLAPGKYSFYVTASSDYAESGPSNIVSAIAESGLPTGTTYYVDTAADPGGDGTTSATTGAHCAWDTIADVNAASFSAGDSILFKKGCTWREQLTVPSSGSAGSPITFGAYGSGANPIISGADLITGSWTQDTNAPIDTQTFETGGLSGTYWVNTGGVDDQVVFKNGAHSWFFDGALGDMFLGRTGATNTNYAEIIYWIRISSSSTATNGHKARLIQFEGSAWNAANGVTLWITVSGTQYRLSLGRGTTLGTTYNVSTDTWYQVRTCVSANGGSSTDHAEMYVDGISRATLTGMSLTSALNSQLYVGAYAFNYLDYKINIDDVNLYTADSTVAPSRWYIADTTEPHVVIINGSKGALQASSSAVVSSGQWYWSSNVLYLYSVNSPATDYTNPGVEAGVRDYTVVSNGKSYIALQYLTFRGGNSGLTDGSVAVEWGTGGAGGDGQCLGWQLSGIDSSMNSQSGVFFDSPGGSVTDSTFAYNGNIGIDFDSGHNMTGVNIIAHHNYLAGIYPGAIHGQLSLTLTNPIVYSNTNNGITIDNAAGVTVNGGSSYLHTYNGVYIPSATNGVTINGMDIHDNGDGFHVAGATSTNVTIRYSLIRNNTTVGIYCETGSPSTIAYNNVLYGNGTGLWITGASTNITAKNNVSQGNTIEVQVDASVNQTPAIDYNDWYHAAGGTFLDWKGTNYNFADWKTNSSQDTHSLSSNPLFVSTITPDFRLQSSSPCINAGVNVGLTSDYRGRNVPGIGPVDIGAYQTIRTMMRLSGHWFPLFVP